MNLILWSMHSLFIFLAMPLAVNSVLQDAIIFLIIWLLPNQKDSLHYPCSNSETLMYVSNCQYLALWEVYVFVFWFVWSKGSHLGFHWCRWPAGQLNAGHFWLSRGVSKMLCQFQSNEQSLSCVLLLTISCTSCNLLILVRTAIMKFQKCNHLDVSNVHPRIDLTPTCLWALQSKIEWSSAMHKCW